MTYYSTAIEKCEYILTPVDNFSFTHCISENEVKYWNSCFAFSTLGAYQSMKSSKVTNS